MSTTIIVFTLSHCLYYSSSSLLLLSLSLSLSFCCSDWQTCSFFLLLLLLYWLPWFSHLLSPLFGWIFFSIFLSCLYCSLLFYFSGACNSYLMSLLIFLALVCCFIKALLWIGVTVNYRKWKESFSGQQYGRIQINTRKKYNSILQLDKLDKVESVSQI